MNRQITDKKADICYTLQGEYYLTDLVLPTEEEQLIGIWGHRHRRYLKEHHRILYYNLLTACKLNSYLADIDRQAEELFSRLVKQMAEREGVTEMPKVEYSMKWVRSMNNIKTELFDMMLADE